MMGLYRQGVIERLIERDGDCCAYCPTKVRKNFYTDEFNDDDATVDHVIPKAKGGTNEIGNLALACRRCNHIKGHRDLAEFLADPNRPCGPVSSSSPKSPRPVGLKSNGANGRAMTPWMRQALHRRFPHLYAPPEPEKPARIPAPKMTAAETAAFLREKGEAQKMLEAIQEHFPGAEVVEVRP